MIYRDTVHVTYRAATGDTDAHGNQITAAVDADVPAIVWPLDTDLTVDTNQSRVSTRYRMALAPTVDLPTNVGTTVTLSWGDYPQMYVDGAIEHHRINGRLHHYELTSKTVT